MYPKAETEISRRYLLSILEELRTRYCLIGGWAVYYLVNGRYRDTHMREYLGSRDIDLGFPDVEGLRDADNVLTGKMGFEQLSFRYVKYLNYDTGEEMVQEDARNVPLHMLVELFVDAMIPGQAGEARDVVGFEPPDEPILTRVFTDVNNITNVNIAGRNVNVPEPELLLAMKLNSVGNRAKDHKRMKDLCDITALCLFTEKGLDEIIGGGLAHADPEKLLRFESTLDDDVYLQVSELTGIPGETVGVLFERLLVGGHKE
jgi:hypothetical protein